MTGDEDTDAVEPKESNGTETVDVKPVRVEKPSTPDINTAPTLDHLYRDCLKLIEERTIGQAAVNFRKSTEEANRAGDTGG